MSTMPMNMRCKDYFLVISGWKMERVPWYDSKSELYIAHSWQEGSIRQYLIELLKNETKNEKRQVFIILKINRYLISSFSSLFFPDPSPPSFLPSPVFERWPFSGPSNSLDIWEGREAKIREREETFPIPGRDFCLNIHVPLTCR